ncbi:MAG: phosphoenolpyruvate synthase [Deltaproteobacteria bacterium]|nr:phosphoenolpyruvate synthase [Deltaproteobacteria bacterium]
MNPAALVLPFTALSAKDLPLVGGKGANLGEMTQAGLPVPPGFCLTTEAFDRALKGLPGLDAALDALDAVRPDDLPGMRRESEALRRLIESTPMPPEVTEALLAAWTALDGPAGAWAVRSSATAEDLPDASFAGQQDTILNVRGVEALLAAVRRCQASLFTERACVYRARAGFSHRQVRLSVVVQRQIDPEVSGILFTADPISGDRDVMSVDAGFGLGEALVSGLIDADLLRMRRSTGEVIERRIAIKRLGIYSLPEGGTVTRTHTEEEARRPALTDTMAAALRQLADRVAAHYGQPQDLEWCFADGALYLLQARPITTLFPLAEPQRPELGDRALMSFGHVQVMTAPMSPLGRSIWLQAIPVGRELDEERPGRLAREAGGRVYFDVTPLLTHPTLGPRALAAVQNIDSRVAADLAEAQGRCPKTVSDPLNPRAGASVLLPVLGRMLRALVWDDPRQLHKQVPSRIDAAIHDARAQVLAEPTPLARLKRFRRLVSRLLPTLLPVAAPVFAGVASERLLVKLLGSDTDAEALRDLTRGLADNITTEMDLEVGDLADLARPYPALKAALIAGEQGRAALSALPGGEALIVALDAFLGRFGMRGPGEIDVGQPRYRDDPGVILRVIAGALHAGEPGGHRAHHNKMKALGDAAVERLTAAARRGPWGWLRAPLARRLATVYRQLFALREHPKFGMIRLLDLGLCAARQAGEELVRAGRLSAAEDSFMLSLPELITALETPEPGDLRALVKRRREEQARFMKLDPPRVMMSGGARVMAPIRRDHLPPGALVGVAASGGVIEGVARVILDPNTDTLKHGEILVAPFTDPGWTPLFVHAAAVVIDVGGLMTHGSVVAREYGIPAVVSVDGGTRTIKTGDRLLVNGDQGYVLIQEA